MRSTSRTAGRTAVAMASAMLLLTSCAQAAHPASVPVAPTPGRPAPSYQYTLTSQCGERSLIGTWHVTVEDDVVTAAEPLAGTVWHPETAEELEVVPTLADLLARAHRTGAAAPSELHVDPETGMPTEIAFEGDPQAIDDEECYRISDYTAGVRGEG